MAAKAFVLVRCEPARTQTVRERLGAIQGAVFYEVMGPYDFILDLEADTPEDLTHILGTNVRVIAGVTDTLTRTVMASMPASG